MAELKEVETKWDAEVIPRHIYNKAIRLFLRGKKVPYRFLQVDGFDYYFTSKTGHTLRHRVSKNTNELTVKARLSKKSIKIRMEGNIRLTKDNDLKEVHGTYKLLGFKEDVSLYKDCDIYFLKDGKADISIVWYLVKKAGFKDRALMEVEVHGITEKKSMKKLKQWEQIMYQLFKLSDKDIINQSLYEMYSGKQYRMADND
jgi:adenylate cyclase class IV